MQNLRWPMKEATNTVTNKGGNHSKLILSCSSIDFVANHIELDARCAFSNGLGYFK